MIEKVTISLKTNVLLCEITMNYKKQIFFKSGFVGLKKKAFANCKRIILAKHLTLIDWKIRFGIKKTSLIKVECFSEW